MKKIANLAETHYLAVAPHSGAAGGAVGVAASAQVCAVIPNFLVMEGGAQRGEGIFRITRAAPGRLDTRHGVTASTCWSTLGWCSHRRCTSPRQVSATFSVIMAESRSGAATPQGEWDHVSTKRPSTNRLLKTAAAGVANP